MEFKFCNKGSWAKESEKCKDFFKKMLVTFLTIEIKKILIWFYVKWKMLYFKNVFVNISIFTHF